MASSSPDTPRIYPDIEIADIIIDTSFGGAMNNVHPSRQVKTNNFNLLTIGPRYYRELRFLQLI